MALLDVARSPLKQRGLPSTALVRGSVRGPHQNLHCAGMTSLVQSYCVRAGSVTRFANTATRRAFELCQNQSLDKCARPSNSRFSYRQLMAALRNPLWDVSILQMLGECLLLERCLCSGQQLESRSFGRPRPIAI